MLTVCSSCKTLINKGHRLWSRLGLGRWFGYARCPLCSGELVSLEDDWRARGEL